MTALNTVPTVGTSHGTISGELLDALIEAVVFPPNPQARSGLICSLVQEICATVEWRHEGDAPLDRASHEELAGIRRLVDAAHEHHRRMAAFGSGDDDEREDM